MNSSAEWDSQYRNNAHMSIWPWSDVVSFVHRHVRPITPALRVLELGCGAGANIPFFKKLGVDYFAIEGSATIVDRLKLTYPELQDRLAVGDFTEAIPFEGGFDLIIDRASLTHNALGPIVRCLELVHRRLHPGGRFIGIDWFSTAYSDFALGEAGDDPHTRHGYSTGSFAGVGQVHFSDRAHLLELFRHFDLTVLEHTLRQRAIPDDGWTFASWNFVAVKN